MATRTEVQTYDLSLEIIEERNDGSYTLGDVRVHVGPSETFRYYPDEGLVTVEGYGSFQVHDGDIWPANGGARRLVSRSDWSKNRARLTTLVGHVEDRLVAYRDRRPMTA